MGLVRSGLLWASRQQWLGEQFRRRSFSRRAVGRFMPGEDLDAAIEAARGLSRKGIGSVLTLLGENLTDLRQAEQVTEHYLEVLSRAEEPGLPAEPSVKPTQLGLDLDADRALENLERIVQQAARQETFVWVDMEGSPYLEPTLEIYREIKRKHPNVGICLQAYLYRTPNDLAALSEVDPVVRLVKGAYREPPELAFPKKRDVDRQYLDLAERLLDGIAPKGRGPVFGTHDLDLIQRIRDRAREMKVPEGHYEVHMLYGIKREAQVELVRDGCPVRVLVSYGSAWFPWYMRRLAERPANLAFVLRSAIGI